MKIHPSTFLLSSALVAAVGAKPFGAIPTSPRAKPVSSARSELLASTAALNVRGGDLGPLTADTAAKALVG